MAILDGSSSKNLDRPADLAHLATDPDLVMFRDFIGVAVAEGLILALAFAPGQVLMLTPNLWTTRGRSLLD